MLNINHSNDSATTSYYNTIPAVKRNSSMMSATRRTSTVVVWKLRNVSLLYDVISVFFNSTSINTARPGTVDELPSVTKLHGEIVTIAAYTVDPFHFTTVFAKLFSPVVKAADVFRDYRTVAQIAFSMEVFRLDVPFVHFWTVPPSHFHQCYRRLLSE